MQLSDVRCILARRGTLYVNACCIYHHAHTYKNQHAWHSPFITFRVSIAGRLLCSCRGRDDGRRREHRCAVTARANAQATTESHLHARIMIRLCAPHVLCHVGRTMRDFKLIRFGLYRSTIGY